MGYYLKLESLQEDFTALVARVTANRCKNHLAREYLAKVYQAAMAHLDRKKNDFNAKWRAFMESKF